MRRLTKTLNIPETIEEFRHNRTFNYVHQTMTEEHNGKVTIYRIQEKYKEDSKEFKTCMAVHKFYVDCVSIILALDRMPLDVFDTYLEDCIERIKDSNYRTCCLELYKEYRSHSDWQVYARCLQFLPSEEENYKDSAKKFIKYSLKGEYTNE